MKIDTKKLPSRVLYVLVGLIVVIFALFWLIGYNRPYDEDGNFNAPLFTDVLLVFMMLLTVGALAVAVWSAIRSNSASRGGERIVNNIPIRKIGRCVTGGTALVLILTFILGSSAPMKINGADYTDTFWLKASDMLVATSLLMIVAAIAAVVYGATKYIRKP